jgi:hypothetical protein
MVHLLPVEGSHAPGWVRVLIFEGQHSCKLDGAAVIYGLTATPASAGHERLFDYSQERPFADVPRQSCRNVDATMEQYCSCYNAEGARNLQCARVVALVDQDTVWPRAVAGSKIRRCLP